MIGRQKDRQKHSGVRYAGLHSTVFCVQGEEKKADVSLKLT